MSKLSQGEREEMLDALANMGGSGQAETEDADLFRLRFYPVAEHARAFDPDVVLIVGERGAGKSELFRAIMDFGLLAALAKHTKARRLPTAEKTIWVKGYPVGTEFPDSAGLQAILDGGNADPGTAQELWFAYLVRLLWGHLDSSALADLGGLRNPQGGDVNGVLEAFRQKRQAPLLALDRLDARLEKEGRLIFVGYDELDTLGGYNWQVMGSAITGLVSFWANYSRRWRRLRAKLFMRTDLYRRNTLSVSADLPKLAANRAEITWNDRNLYAMLVKRIANSSLKLKEYCESAGVSFKAGDELGAVPEFSTTEGARSLVSRIAGTYMGANERKGITFNWLLDHVRDGQDRVLPRALVCLVEQAANHEREVPRAEGTRLLHHTSLRRALDEVSRQQVTQAIAHEWPWLQEVAARLRGESVLLKRSELEGLLRKDWESWARQAGKSPPADDARNLVSYLVELGIVRERGDRLDVPDLYLAGLGMKRKGGVKRNA